MREAEKRRINVTDELEDKAAEMPISLTQSLAEGPENLIGVYIALLLKNKDNPEALKQVNETARLFLRYQT
jgi:hypothetical protein